LEKEDSVDPHEIAHIFGRQIVVGSRLQEFYHYATMAAGGRVKRDKWDGFISKLGLSLYPRRLTRSFGDQLVADLKNDQGELLNVTNRTARIKTVQDAVVILQGELAAVDVFIQTLKASKDTFL
jgi:hypothetical protein